MGAIYKLITHIYLITDFKHFTAFFYEEKKGA